MALKLVDIVVPTGVPFRSTVYFVSEQLDGRLAADQFSEVLNAVVFDAASPAGTPGTAVQAAQLPTGVQG